MDYVMGVIYTINAHEKQRLDQAEGLGRGYNEATLSLMIAGNQHKVFFYVADPHYIEDSLKPFTWYKALVMLGCHAHQLPDAYTMQYVARVDAVPDHNPTRTHAHLHLLTN